MTLQGDVSHSGSHSESTDSCGRTDTFDKYKEGYPKDDRGDVNVVAIVGAGFSGLVLANYLERQTKSFECQTQTKEGFDQLEYPRWTYKLFESKSSSGIPIIGTISIPSARDVLEELCLFDEACSEQSGANPVFSGSNKISSATNDNNYQLVSRESFLELLRKNVTIQSSSRVVDIIEESCTNRLVESKDKNNPQYVIVTEDGNQERIKHGPFDLVVAASGLSFRGDASKAFQQKLRSSSWIIKIGDSRYRYGRSWWNFDFLGTFRRKFGAETAIQDSLLVGRRLLQCDRCQQQQKKQQLRRAFSAEALCLSLQSEWKLLEHEKLLKAARVIVVILPMMLSLYFMSAQQQQSHTT